MNIHEEINQIIGNLKTVSAQNKQTLSKVKQVIYSSLTKFDGYLSAAQITEFNAVLHQINEPHEGELKEEMFIDYSELITYVNIAKIPRENVVSIVKDKCWILFYYA